MTEDKENLDDVLLTIAPRGKQDILLVERPRKRNFSSLAFVIAFKAEMGESNYMSTSRCERSFA